MNNLVAISAVFAVLVAGPAYALGEILVPWPLEETYRESDETGRYRLPIGPYRNDRVPIRTIEGSHERVGFRITSDDSVTELTQGFRDALQQQNFRELFHCDDRGCGGFDFRKELDVIPGPEIYIDLGNFQFVAAIRTGDVSEYAAILVSRNASYGFVQIDTINSEKLVPSVSAATALPSSTEPVKNKLESEGHAVLERLEFASGAPDLSSVPFAQIQELADYMKNNTEACILLVGHTDSKGSLESNVELSRMRATAVATRLIEGYGIDPSRLSSDGIGFLAPRASNRTEEGRQRNRRVDAVLIDCP
ncbi:MAG: OmpA family protein [Rhodobacteraceae bacterium]|nr:OmpA family protein [Paracoccaceae bacterium]MCY4326569.1 OmpA family protein [Paracoccaceae bacterium]